MYKQEFFEGQSSHESEINEVECFISNFSFRINNFRKQKDTKMRMQLLASVHFYRRILESKMV